MCCFFAVKIKLYKKNEKIIRLIFTCICCHVNNNCTKTSSYENFGGSYAHNESMSTNSSGWTHTGTGDFVHKIVSGAGASGSIVLHN